MNLYDDAVTATITQQEAEAYRGRRRSDDRCIGNSCDLTENRWAGYVGQDHLRAFLEANEIPHVPLCETDPGGPYDFRIDTKEGVVLADMKVMVTTVNPRPMYRGVVREDQLLNDRVTHYVWGYFNLPALTSRLVGWLPKDRFLQLCEKHKEGEVIDTGFTVLYPMSSVRIREMRGMFHL